MNTNKPCFMLHYSVLTHVRVLVFGFEIPRVLFLVIIVYIIRLYFFLVLLALILVCHVLQNTSSECLGRS